MPDTKISALTAETSLGDTDELVVASSGATKKITGLNLKASVVAAATNATQAELDTHAADTTAVHGISDTTALLTSSAAAAAYQPLDSDLTALAALATTSFGRALLELANQAALLSAAGAQPSDATLTALAAANWAANAVPIGTGADALSQTAFAANTFPARASSGNLVAKTITDAGLALVDDADASAMRTTLGLGTAAIHATGDYDAAGAAAAAQAASQPVDSDLTAIAALTTTSYGRAFLALADAAAARTALALGTAAVAATGDFDAAGAAAAAQAASQPLDGTLTALAAANWAANSIPVGTGADALSQTALAANKLLARSSSGNVAAKDISDAGLALIDDADASAQRTTLGLGSLATQSGTFSGTSSGTNTGDQTISDATITTTDITTNNVSTSKHGFAPKAPNDATKYLDGAGAYTVPAGSGAPTNATYITQVAESGLSAEQSLAALATGMLKSTTTTGVLSIGAEGTDYWKPGATDVAVADGGTGASTAAGARTNLGLPDLPWTIVTKAADESLTSNTTAQADDELFFTPASGGVYEVEISMIYASPAGAGTPDIKANFYEDATIRGQLTWCYLTSTDAAGDTPIRCGSGSIQSAGTAATKRVIYMKGWYVGSGAQAGVFWAQNTSDVNAVTVYAGSVLRYRRVV